MKEESDEEIMEQVAGACHMLWSVWISDMMSECMRDDSGNYTIDKLLIDKWKRWSNLEYNQLSDEGKELDRLAAQQFIRYIQEVE